MFKTLIYALPALFIVSCYTTGHRGPQSTENTTSKECIELDNNEILEPSDQIKFNIRQPLEIMTRSREDNSFDISQAIDEDFYYMPPNKENFNKEKRTLVALSADLEHPTKRVIDPNSTLTVISVSPKFTRLESVNGNIYSLRCFGKMHRTECTPSPDKTTCRRASTNGSAHAYNYVSKRCTAGDVRQLLKSKVSISMEPRCLNYKIQKVNLEPSSPNSDTPIDL